MSLGSARGPLGPSERVREEYKNYKYDTKTREDYLSALQDRYFEVRPQLTEYRLNLENIFNPAVGNESSLGASAVWSRQTGREGSLEGWKAGFRSWPGRDGMDGTGGRPGNHLLDGELTAEECAALVQARAEWKRLDIRGRIQGATLTFKSWPVS